MRKEDLTFLSQCIKSFQTTGAVCRSSKKAAQALIEPLRSKRLFDNGDSNEKDIPLRVIELGPGTGSVTVEIMKALGPKDELIICEINPSFMNTLQKKLANMPEFNEHKERIRFCLCPAQELPEDIGQFDLVVCCLPFLNLTHDLVRQIFERINQLSHQHTKLTYFEYAGLRHIGRMFSPRIRSVDKFVSQALKSRREKSTIVWGNFPPMRVHELSAM